MSLVVGLTGSIATGKSTVVEWFKNMDVPVIDADHIAKEIVQPGRPMLARLKEHFGDEIIQEDQSLNRTRLGQIIFNDEASRKALNRLMHPAIIEEITSQSESLKAQGVPLVLIDIPLLYESRLNDLVDRVLVVYTSIPLQLERLMIRDKLSKQEAIKRMEAQLSIEKKKQQADDVIDNSGTIDETIRQCQIMYDKYQSLIENHH